MLAVIQSSGSVLSEITSSHNKYVENMIGNIKEISKPFWKYISSTRKDTQSIPPLDTKHGTTAESDVDKAEALNDQFTGVFTKKTLLSIGCWKKWVIIGVNSFVSSFNIFGLISSGPRAFDIFKPFNTSELSSCFTECILCKLAEHIVCSNIMSHLEEHNVITHKQHAFRKHHSCETQLCSVIHDWARNIDKSKQTDIFILDFEKVFDTVPHEYITDTCWQLSNLQVVYFYPLSVGKSVS
jgi:hypothetical protein